jgi:hypothetical protein
MASRSKLAQMMVEVLVLCNAPIGSSEASEETMNISVATFFTHAVKFADQRLHFFEMLVIIHAHRKNDRRVPDRREQF